MEIPFSKDVLYFTVKGNFDIYVIEIVVDIFENLCKILQKNSDC